MVSPFLIKYQSLAVKLVGLDRMVTTVFCRSTPTVVPPGVWRMFTPSTSTRP